MIQTWETDLLPPPALPGQAGVESRAENHCPGAGGELMGREKILWM